MIIIKKISNKEEIHQYVFDIMPDTHGQLINFFNKIGFNQDEIIELDTPFSELDGEYLFIKNDDMKVHFFIYNNKVNMIIDSNKSQEELTNLMRMHFIFPK